MQVHKLNLHFCAETRKEACPVDFFVQRAELLKELIFVRGAVEKTTTIPILSHFLLNANGLELTITATDTELAARTACPASVKAEGIALVPGVRFLIRLQFQILLPRLAEEDGEGTSVETSKDGSHIYFSLGSRMLASRLLTGQFPNYESVLPKENGKAVELNPEEFGDVIRRVSLLADERVPGVRLVLEKDRLEVSASSPEYGEARYSVESSSRDCQCRYGMI
jgi:DNA polymerase III sliding clamp (beta) subunit (PCNA family)